MDFLPCGVYSRVADDESLCSEPAGCEPAYAMTNPMSAEAAIFDGRRCLWGSLVVATVDIGPGQGCAGLADADL